MHNDEDNSIKLDGTEHVQTFGGEAYLDGWEFAEYGIGFGEHSIHGLTPEQAIELATTLVNHLIINGHEFALEDNFHQDQRLKLTHIKNK